MYFLYILLALIFVLTILSFMPVSAEIHYEYINKVQKLDIVLRLFKIIKIKIPVNQNKKEKKIKDENAKKTKRDFSIERLKQLFSDIENALSDSKSEIFKILSTIKKHLLINRVLFEMEYGLSDAAKTGMANGALWASSSGVLSAIDNFSEIKSVSLNIYPVFDRECFNARFIGIITLKFTHIISIGIKLLKVVNCFSKNLIKDK